MNEFSVEDLDTTDVDIEFTDDVRWTATVTDLSKVEAEQRTAEEYSETLADVRQDSEG